METKNQLIILLGLSMLLIAGSLTAGTVNVDFQGSNGVTFSSPGLIGTGSHWGTHDGGTGTVPLYRDNGTRTLGIGIRTLNLNASGYRRIVIPALNHLHFDGIADSGTLDIALTGFPQDRVYKVVVYLLHESSGSIAVSVDSGAGRLLASATRTTFPQQLSEAVEGKDYLVFEGVASNPGTGEIRVTVEGRIAGLQLQGWLPGESYPSKTDLHISKKRNSGYIGDDVYGGRQLQKVTRKRRGKFYYCLENDASVWATYGLRGKASDGDAVRKWFDLTEGRKNITAEVASQTYRVGLCSGEKRRLLGILRAKPGTRKAVSVLRGFAVEDKSVPYADRNKAILVP